MKKEMSFCALKVDPVEINGKVVKIMIIKVQQGQLQQNFPLYSMYTIT
jgi:hypothetical protein